jgi:hypothetical protein
VAHWTQMRRRGLLFILSLLASSAAAQAGWSDKEKERFLLDAEVVNVRDAPDGVTGSLQAKLERAGATHLANIQKIDQEKSLLRVGHTSEIDFRDSYKNNVAAYRLDRLLGLGMVPVTVVREHDGKPASFTWWVDDLLMTEKERIRKKMPAPDVEVWNRQVFVVRLFDQLIFNFDRNLGNLLVDTEWRIWMIDHTRAFKIFPDLRSPKELADSCEQDLLAALRALEKPVLEAEMKDLLNEGQIDGLLGRRDTIVRFYDDRLKKKGPARVYYDLPSRLAPGPRP